MLCVSGSSRWSLNCFGLDTNAYAVCIYSMMTGWYSLHKQSHNPMDRSIYQQALSLDIFQFQQIHAFHHKHSSHVKGGMDPALTFYADLYHY